MLPESRSPNALTLVECRIIGWTMVERDKWLCPLHSEGGIGKLEEIAKKGLSGT
jgi:hypothetical protein